jgi:hypothetical protein
MPPDDRNDTDRRSSAREKVIKGVEVILNDRKSAIPGLIGNLSETGAKFVVNSPVDLPRDVTLHFPTGEERKAEVTWQKNGIQFGLRFIDPGKV